MNPPALPRISVVVIGRNEGERLVRCLHSVKASHIARQMLELIYVDSASTDESQAWAAALGAKVIEVRPERPSAALGRNAGWREARGEFVLFLDGDTILHPQFIERALSEMADPKVAVVWGHRREIAPEQSIYVRVLDLDWIYPPGPSAFCGGDALMRRSVLEQVGGYDDGLIAGEEPELCRRIRAGGWEIRHIDAPMTGHDLAICSFKAYWRRAFRAGHAYAEVASRFRGSGDPLWQRECRRNLLHGGGLLLAPGVLATAATYPPLLAMLMTLAAGLIIRTVRRCAWKSPDLSTRVLYALHAHFQQIPILFGQLAQRLDERFGRRRGLIEYK